MRIPCNAQIQLVRFFFPPWFQPVYQGSSSDYYHQCSSDIFSSVPVNYYGFQFAYEGKGYCGIFLYNDINESREYIEVQLKEQLHNQSYCVQLKVSLADSSNIAISLIGMRFSLDSTTANNYDPLSVGPQFENSPDQIIDNKTNWVEIIGEYEAIGGERFITIGNFYNDSTTLQNSKKVSNSTSFDYAYYYIDNVSVKEIPSQLQSPAGNDTTICYGESLQLGKEEVEGYSYIWTTTTEISDSNSARITVSPEQTTTYYLTLTDTGDVCSCRSQVKDTVSVTVEECPVPNVFSPNGDGINELFAPRFPVSKGFKVSIYNRWGSLVYEYIHPGQGWDGRTMDGKECPGGTYYYVIQYQTMAGEEKVKKGSLTLMR